jgi:hypothetical protein
MSKHTPGPWFYRLGDGRAFRPIVQRGDEGGFVVEGMSRERENADAKLIAAAPELLDSLFELLARCKRQKDFNDDGDGEAFDRAEFAIKKATGE